MSSTQAKNQNQVLLQNLQKALGDQATYDKVANDFAKTFSCLGVQSKTSAYTLGVQVLSYIISAKTLEDAETNVKAYFAVSKFSGVSVMQMVQNGLQDRFEIIYKQLEPHLKSVTGPVIDYGCGSGILSQMLHDRLGLTIEGVDVRDFRAPSVTVPVRLFDGYSVPIDADHYACAVLTNVIHHEVNNEKILEELDRIVRDSYGKLVIIETVPEADTDEAAKADWGRMLLNDTLWNRFFNYADIPVPGTYEIPSRWIERFEEYGWKVTHEEDLGFDQPTIQDRHHLFVFQR